MNGGLDAEKACASVAEIIAANADGSAIDEAAPEETGEAAEATVNG